jgi:hypothetical protein
VSRALHGRGAVSRHLSMATRLRLAIARIARGESASAFYSQPPWPPITTTHQQPPLSQHGTFFEAARTVLAHVRD